MGGITCSGVDSARMPFAPGFGCACSTLRLRASWAALPLSYEQRSTGCIAGRRTTRMDPLAEPLHVELRWAAV